jgi:hypothetical protein
MADKMATVGQLEQYANRQAFDMHTLLVMIHTVLDNIGLVKDLCRMIAEYAMWKGYSLN